MVLIHSCVQYISRDAQFISAMCIGYYRIFGVGKIFYYDSLNSIFKNTYKLLTL